MANMKHKDFKPCALCGKGMMHANHPLFCRVSIERLGTRVDRVKRQDGLEMMMGGNALLANVMGLDEDLAEVLEQQKDLLICSKCLDENPVLYLLLMPENVPAPPAKG